MSNNNEFRKRPVVIEAWQVHPNDGKTRPLPPEWLLTPMIAATRNGDQAVGDVCVRDDGNGLDIYTLEGVMHAQTGDWIIRGVKGELYPCKPDIFEATYERAALAAQPVAQVPDNTVTVLPDGSAFGVMSFPLPKDHWLYRERVYMPGSDEPVELPSPVLTHEDRDRVVAAVRYAVRGATNCGKEEDFDPDALVQNAVYALCGPFTRLAAAPSPEASNPVQAEAPSDELVIEIAQAAGFRWIPPDDDPDGYPGGFDMSNISEMRNLLGLRRLAAHSPASGVGERDGAQPSTECTRQDHYFGERRRCKWCSTLEPVAPKLPDKVVLALRSILAADNVKLMKTQTFRAHFNQAVRHAKELLEGVSQ